tara:strand:- start:544 stop:762 length:219 start_codon:yes stop_codon:yes gene_type:complete
MSSTQIFSLSLTMGMSILSGGILLGRNFDKITVLCEEMDTLKKEHDILREKVYDIHTKVCVIDQKLTHLIKE